MAIGPIGNFPIKPTAQGSVKAAGAAGSQIASDAIKAGEDLKLFTGLPIEEAKFGRYELLGHYVPSVVSMVQEMRSAGVPEDQIIPNLRALGVIADKT